MLKTENFRRFAAINNKNMNFKCILLMHAHLLCFHARPYGRGEHGNKVVLKLRQIGRFFPQIEVRFIFKPLLRVQNFFQNNDPMPPSLLSSVVYKYITLGKPAATLI